MTVMFGFYPRNHSKLNLQSFEKNGTHFHVKIDQTVQKYGARSPHWSSHRSHEILLIHISRFIFKISSVVQQHNWVQKWFY